MNQIPNFFLVGAPKCGTTSMHAYLQEHPEIFMSTPKEPHHFSTDIPLLIDTFDGQIDERNAYLRLFEDAKDEVAIGEGSVWYLYSEVAAQNIYEFNPEARIICLLRHPVEMAWSMFRFMNSLGFETTTDFRRAIDEGDLRAEGKNIPFGLHRACCVLYKESAMYGKQLERYFTVWPRDRIHVAFYEDLRDDPSKVYKQVTTFLGCSSDFSPEFAIHNKTDVSESGHVSRIRRQYRKQLILANRCIPEFVRVPRGT